MNLLALLFGLSFVYGRFYNIPEGDEYGKFMDLIISKPDDIDLFKTFFDSGLKVEDPNHLRFLNNLEIFQLCIENMKPCDDSALKGLYFNAAYEQARAFEDSENENPSDLFCFCIQRLADDDDSFRLELFLSSAVRDGNPKVVTYLLYHYQIDPQRLPGSFFCHPGAKEFHNELLKDVFICRPDLTWNIWVPVYFQSEIFNAGTFRFLLKNGLNKNRLKYEKSYMDTALMHDRPDLAQVCSEFGIAITPAVLREWKLKPSKFEPRLNVFFEKEEQFQRLKYFLIQAGPCVLPKELVGEIVKVY